MIDDALPPPYGVPPEPQLSQEQLLRHYLDGGQTGSSEAFRIEATLLVAAGSAPLAIRLDGGVLVREDLAAEEPILSLRTALLEALGEAGHALVDEDATLGAVVGIEVAGIRGGMWSLWARNAEEGQSALERRALGDLAERVDADEVRRREQIDETLADLERYFET